jgi:NAD(P)-dependent dehydrogenase (short-subunit alcohol dehydrogenase family)
VIDSALAELGGIDLLVNNVGGGDQASQSFLDAQDSEWAHMFEINVLSAVRQDGLRPGPTRTAPHS